MASHEDIRKRAHEIWEQEGRPHGRAYEHWQQAERELGSPDVSEPEIAEDALGLPSDVEADPSVSPLETDTPPASAVPGGAEEPAEPSPLGRLGRLGK